MRSFGLKQGICMSISSARLAQASILPNMLIQVHVLNKAHQRLVVEVFLEENMLVDQPGQGHTVQ